MLNRRLTTAIVASAAALPAAIPAAAQATFPGRNGMIVALFNNLGNGSSPRAIFEGIQPNGQASRIYFCTEFVGKCGNAVGNPSISPDGKQLAFDGGIETDSYVNQDQLTLLRFGKFGLKLLRFTTSDSNEQDTAPSWVNGQSGLMFAVSGGPRAGLAFEHSNGTGAKLVLPCGNCQQPAVSPSGLTMLYSKGAALWSAGIDGTTPTQVVPNGSHPSWAPNGKQIAFVSGGSVYVSGPTGAGQRRLASKAFDPVWSPNGKLIAYAVKGKAKGVVVDVFTRRSTGGSAHLLYTEKIASPGATFAGMDWQALS